MPLLALQLELLFTQRAGLQLKQAEVRLGGLREQGQVDDGDDGHV